MVFFAPSDILPVKPLVCPQSGKERTILKRPCLASLLFVFALRCALSQAVLPDPAVPATPAPAPKLEFSEVWAYLMDGEEKYLDPAMSITDLGYFGASIGMSGTLLGVPNRGKLPVAYKGRVHLVVAELGNLSLTHFCLSPEYPLREALIADIAKGAEGFDGVQIDFEAVSFKDYENFYAFLGLLKKALADKTLSVALSAQIKESADNLSYERIGKIADRIIVMAYDEHWSASAPGPVASIEWCRKVSAYAQSKVAEACLVMGAPFYGRAWADKSPSRAYKHSSLIKLIDEKGIGDIRRQDGIPYMEYPETVNVKVFFEDYDSTLARLSMYRARQVKNVAFWRLGQEDPIVWGAITASHASIGAPFAEASAPACSLP
jgi:spore germination protein